MLFNTYGGYNTAIGVSALQANTSGSQNAAFGMASLYSNTTATNNAALGYYAGYTVTTGSNNTFLGTMADASTGVLTYATAIGAGAIVSTSNTLSMGRLTDKVLINGTLDVSSFYFHDGSQGAGKVLTSDANGVASWQNGGAVTTIIYRKCAWNSAGGVGSCTPGACPAGWTNLGTLNVASGGVRDSVNNMWYVGHSEYACSNATSYAVLYMKCAWNGAGGPNSCTPSACPVGWTNQGTNNEASGGFMDAVNNIWYMGHSEYICTK
jgi:hypothetical protein